MDPTSPYPPPPGSGPPPPGSGPPAGGSGPPPPAGPGAGRFGGYPSLTPAHQILLTAGHRDRTDYVFSFWTALGWTILTCGIYGLYVVFRLVERSRDHNRRRIEMLSVASALAWERAEAAGRAEELRPRFDRTSASSRSCIASTAGSATRRSG